MTGNLNYGKTYNYLDTLKRRGYKPRQRRWDAFGVYNLLKCLLIYTKLWTISSIFLRDTAYLFRTHSTPLECGRVNIPFSIDIALRWSAGGSIYCFLFSLRSNTTPYEDQDYLVFGSDLGFRSQMLRFSRNIASTARSYSGKTFTHIK